MYKYFNSAAKHMNTDFVISVETEWILICSWIGGSLLRNINSVYIILLTICDIGPSSGAKAREKGGKAAGNLNRSQVGDPELGAITTFWVMSQQRQNSRTDNFGSSNARVLGRDFLYSLQVLFLDTVEETDWQEQLIS